MSKTLKTTNLIAVSGKQYAGKDLLTRMLLTALPDFRQVPIAQAIKTVYARRHGLTLQELEAQKAQHRPGLIALGDWGRAQDPDYWLRAVLAEPGKKIVSDVRLPREYALLKQAGAFLIRLNADRVVRARRGQLVSETDPTEQALDTLREWDAVLTNNTTIEDLQAQVQALLAR